MLSHDNHSKRKRSQRQLKSDLFLKTPNPHMVAAAADAIDRLKRRLGIKLDHGSDRALADRLKKSKQVIANWRLRGAVPASVLKDYLPEDEFKYVLSELILAESGQNKSRITEYEPVPDNALYVKEEPSATTGADLALVHQTVDELLAGEVGFTAEMKAELYGLALDELRELRSEGRESRFRRRLERLVSYSKRLTQKGRPKGQTTQAESSPTGKPKA